MLCRCAGAGRGVRLGLSWDIVPRVPHRGGAGALRGGGRGRRASVVAQREGTCACAAASRAPGGRSYPRAGAARGRPVLGGGGVAFPVRGGGTSQGSRGLRVPPPPGAAPPGPCSPRRSRGSPEEPRRSSGLRQRALLPGCRSHSLMGGRESAVSKHVNK